MCGSVMLSRTVSSDQIWPAACWARLARLRFRRGPGFTGDGGLDYHAPSNLKSGPTTEAIGGQHGEHVMSKSQDAKKNVKKAPTKTPKEKKEAKRLKKAERKF
jgi:hypothetical protein